MGTIAISTQERWNAGDRTVGGRLNMNPTGLCPINRGNLFQFEGETWMDLTCAFSDAPIFGNHRSQFNYQKLAAPRNPLDSIYINNRFYYFECYLKDWLYDNSNLLIFQCKYGDYYPQVAIWVSDDASPGVLKFRVVVQTNSTTPDAAVHDPATNFYPVAITSNQKLRFLVEIDWQTNNTGRVYIELNGTPILNESLQTLDAQANPSQPKYPNVLIGPYCFPWVDPGPAPAVAIREMYTRNLIVGNSDFTRTEFKALIETPVDPPPPTGTNNTNEITGIYTN